jgi:hypothetical protein
MADASWLCVTGTCRRGPLVATGVMQVSLVIVSATCLFGESGFFARSGPLECIYSQRSKANQL